MLLFFSSLLFYVFWKNFHVTSIASRKERTERTRKIIRHGRRLNANWLPMPKTGFLLPAFSFFFCSCDAQHVTYVAREKRANRVVESRLDTCKASESIRAEQVGAWERNTLIRTCKRSSTIIDDGRGADLAIIEQRLCMNGTAFAQVNRAEKEKERRRLNAYSSRPAIVYTSLLFQFLFFLSSIWTCGRINAMPFRRDQEESEKWNVWENKWWWSEEIVSSSSDYTVLWTGWRYTKQNRINGWPWIMKLWN